MSRYNSLTYSDEINDKLIKWMNETGYTIVQINGQRISSSPRLDRSPGRGCEVFVGKIPRDCYEDELFPVFQSIGPIHELRLMMMFSGTNRGYAFVMYERMQDAQRAVKYLDNHEIRRGHRIGVLPCVNNCRLFVGCFEPGVKSDEPAKVLRSETDGVVSVIRRVGKANRWFLLVEYNNHRSAAIARRELTPRRSQLFGHKVIVDWEVPLEKRGPGRRTLVAVGPAGSGTGMRLLRSAVVLQKHGEDPMYLNERSLSGHHIPLDVMPQSTPMLHAESNQLQLLNTPPPPYRPLVPQVQAGLHLGGFPHATQFGTGWQYNGSMFKRPRSNADNNAKPIPCRNANQDGRVPFNRINAVRYQQVVSNAQQMLMRSTDSSLYSDPDCQRPHSSDSSGSSNSNHSSGDSLPMASWDGSTGSVQSAVSLSGSSSFSNWDRSACGDYVDMNHSDLSQGRQVKGEEGKNHWVSKSVQWQIEEQAATDINGNRVVGTWNPFTMEIDDYELRDNLLFKDNDSVIVHSSPVYEDIHLQLKSLSVQSDDNVSKRDFNRAVQPPTPQASTGNQQPMRPRSMRDFCNNSVFC